MRQCIKCNKSIPSNIKINGKFQGTYGRKQCFDCKPYYQRGTSPYSRKNPDKLCSKCHNKCECQTSTYCNKCSTKYTVQRLLKYKMRDINYKGGKCEKCGYNKCPAALDFHHKDPTQKKFRLSRKKRAILTKEIRDELDKCILLCANCHRELHYLPT